MYEAKVRCSDDFKGYIEQVHRATTLNRNQIQTLMFFAAPFSAVFRSKIEGRYLANDYASLPAPAWEPRNDGLWLTSRGEGGAIDERTTGVIRISSSGPLTLF